MGLFVSKLLSNDVHTLELMMSEIARAIREGQWERLMQNDSFWSIVSAVSSNPSTLSELRGYVSGLLEEDWRTSSMLLDMLSPGMSSTQRRFVVSIVKLQLISRALRSEVFWHLVLDRGFVTAVWKHATGRPLTPVEERTMRASFEEIQKQREAAQMTPASVQTNSDSAVPLDGVPLPVVDPPAGVYVPPVPLERFFTILTLPAILTLLQDIAQTPDIESDASNAQKPPPPSRTSSDTHSTGSRSRGSGPKRSPAPTVAAPITAKPPSDSKTNMILLLHRDLLKLDHIFDRERAAVAPVVGQDPAFTGLGFERKYYIILRGAIKWMLRGSETTPPPPPPPSGGVEEHARAGSMTPSSGTGATSAAVASSPPSPQLSLFARVLLDPLFQHSFLNSEFLSHVFQRKLHYFLSIFPYDMGVASWPATAATAAESDSSSSDLQLCHSLRAYGTFFLRLFSDPHVHLFCTLMRHYDTLVLEHAFDVLYVDVLLPLMRPAQYVERLTAPRPATNRPNAKGVKTNGFKSDGTKSGGGDSKHVAPRASSPAGPAAEVPTPVDLTPSIPATAPFSAPPEILFAIGFMYHWLFQPVPTMIITQSKSHVDEVKRRHARERKTSTCPSSSSTTTPSAAALKPLPMTRLRDLLMHVDLYLSWSRLAATPPQSLSAPIERPYPSPVPLFTARLHSLSRHPSSLALLDFLQTYTAHIAFCASKTLDELNAAWQTDDDSSTPKPAAAPADRDMFAPQLSFHQSGHEPHAPPPPSTSVPKATVAPTPAPPSGIFSSIGSWFWGRPATTGTTPTPTSVAAPSPSLVPSADPRSLVRALTLALSPQLVSPRSEFDLYCHRQLRLWCSRILEGRGFRLFDHEQSVNGMATPSRLRSSLFMFGQTPSGQAAAEAASSQALFPPLAPIAPERTDPTDPTRNDVFYVELMLFEPEFIEKLIACAFTYEWIEQQDKAKVREKVQAKLRASTTNAGTGVVTGDANSTTSLSSQLRSASSASPPAFHSALYPVAARNVSRPSSTPIDLGPLRTREYIALLCRELSALLQEAHVGNFLDRSENFWKFLTDTRWWDIAMAPPPPPQAPQAHLNDATYPESTTSSLLPVSSSQSSSLRSLLSLISADSSSYYRVLLELGHHQQFHLIFSDANIERALRIMRVLCSWNVHERMALHDEANQQRAQAGLGGAEKLPATPLSNFSATSTDESDARLELASPIASADLYSTLTSPFTLWGVVHSLSVVTPLRDQYKGAVRWFLSKRNMEMQVEIWKVAKEVLYGEDVEEEATSNNNADPIQSGVVQVPAPSPLHSFPSASSSSPYARQQVRLRRLLSVSQICKSVHGSGVIQAIFTFPLATAHFYAACAANFIWNAEDEHDAANRATNSATPSHTASDASTAATTSTEPPSTTSLFVSQLFSLLYTMSQAADAYSFLHLPMVRSAFLEWLTVALDATVSYGSGDTAAAQYRERMEAADRDRQRRETKAHAKRVAADLKRAADEKKANERREKAEAKRSRSAAGRKENNGRGRRNTSKTKEATPSATGHAATDANSFSSATLSSSPPSAPDMFSVSTSYRASIPSTSPPSSIGSVIGVPARFASVVDFPSLSSTVHTRVEGELRRLYPFEPTASDASSSGGEARVESSLLPENIPPRFTKTGDPSEADCAAMKRSRSEQEATDDSSSSDEDAVVLPPPFAFEIAAESNQKESSSGAAPATAVHTPAEPQPRSLLHAEPALDIDMRFSASSSSSSSGAPPSSLVSLPPLPQRHRLIYAFFQLLLRQPIFKLVLTSTTFWEMWSDVSFLEIVTAITCGEIDTSTKQKASRTTPTQPAGTLPSLLSSARSHLAHTTHMLSSRLAKLKLLQRLFAHSRFRIVMAELKSKQFEVYLAQAMHEILAFLNTRDGQALVAAIMDAIKQRETRSGVNAPSMSLSTRLRALTGLLSHESTVRLLTSSQFWLLFADQEMIDYFTHGRFIRLWLHQQQTLRHHLPVWEWIKKGSSRVREQAMRRRQGHATGGGENDTTSQHDSSQGHALDWKDPLGLESSSASHSPLSPVPPRAQSKREAIKGFVKQRLTPRILRTPAAATHTTSPSTASSLPDDPSAAESASAPSPPAGLAAMHHFITIAQAVYALVTGRVGSADALRAHL